MSEYILQRTVADYLNLKYPDVIYRSDLAGVRLYPGLRAKVKRIQKPGIKYPDLFIAHPALGHYGYYLELKIDRDEIYTKNGAPRQDQHTQGQAKTLEQLRHLGYKADFACGVDETISLIDEYLEKR